MSSLKNSILRATSFPARVAKTLTSRLQTSSPARLLSVSLVIILLGSVVLPAVWEVQKASAFTNYSQTDWSGGVGADAATQYSSVNNATPANGSVAIGPSAQAGWCNTASCDANWSARKPIYVNNGDNRSFTDYQQKVIVNFESGSMNNDFSDLRFANLAGNQDLSYFIQRKTDGVNATVFVKIPTLDQGANRFYMYFGNSGAAAASNVDTTMDFSDHFSSNPTTYWDSDCANYANGEAQVRQGCGLGNRYPYNIQDNSTDRVGEYDYKLDLSSTTNCSAQFQNANYSKLTWNPNQFPGDPDAFTVNNSVVQGNSCGANAQWFVSNFNIAHLYDSGHSINFYQSSHPNFQSGQFVRFRFVNHAAGGLDFYYSTDDGDTYHQLPVFSDNDQQYATGMLFTTDQFPVTIRRAYTYKTSPLVDAQASVGNYQWRDGRVGSLTSAVIDMGQKAFFGKLNFTRQGSGRPVLRIRSSANSDMSGANDFEACNPLSDNSDIDASVCFHAGHQYMQYQMELSDSGGHDLQINSVTLEHDNDTQAPGNASNIIIKKSPTGSVVGEGAWLNSSTPYISWTAANDNVNGSGIAGYCVYIGTNASADPANSAGILPVYNSPNYNGINTAGLCQYATSQTSIDASGFAQSLNFADGATYYVRIKAIDKAGNLTEDTPAQASFGFDNTPAQFNTLFTVPTAVATSQIKATWLYVPGLTQGVDTASGFAGIKYCVAAAITGFSGCGENDPNWYGANHGSGDVHDASDVFRETAAELTTSPQDAARLDDAIVGVNAIYFSMVDNAGNASIDNNFRVFQITHTASSEPTSLQVTPTNNSANNFSFSWGLPATLYGSSDDANYCWTVNVVIAADGSNCNWSGKGIRQLAAGPYATQQGLNTFYVATKDVTGNFDSTKVATTIFITNTIAPGVPQDLDISDVSIRATSSWKLGMSWTEPSQTGSGIHSYRILRSTDNSNFTEVGSTSNTNTSFIDTNLNQVTYYYKVKACDDANSCGIASNSVSKIPSGHFTEPAKLTADTDQPKIKDVTTRKASVFWFTDRDSDSKVAIGKSSGNYFTEEIGNSLQTSDHAVNLTNLEPGTTYHFVTKWTDSDGNTGQSVDRTFTTLPAPAISDVSPKNVGITSADIVFTIKNAAKANLYFGKNEGFGTVKETNTSDELSSYTISLANLDDGVKYFYKINGFDIDGNEYQGNVYSFTTPSRPRISNFANEPVDGEPSSTRKISWTTNVPTTSQLSYAPKNGKQTDVINSSLVLQHEVVIRGLEDDTDYTLTALSADSAGNVATSDGNTFRTALDTRPPKISNVVVETAIRGAGVDAKGQVVVSWKTDELATSQVSFGQGESGGFTSKTPQDSRLTLDHTMIVSDLSTSSIYRVEAVSQDKSQNSAVSEPETAIVGRSSDNVFSIIFNALRRTFGVKQ